MNVLEAWKKRRAARQERRKLSVAHRQYADRIAAEIWSENSDIGEAERITRHRIAADQAEYGFDPATVVLLIRLAILVYQSLKHLNVLSPTPAQVSAIFEDESDE